MEPLWDSIFSGMEQKTKKDGKSEKQVLTMGEGFGILTECPSGGTAERLRSSKKFLRKPKKPLDKPLVKC